MLRRHFPALTSVRAIAAWMVFFHHFTPANLPRWLHLVLAEGHVGVSVFFVLSGFLIYYRYAQQAGKPGFWPTYVRNRVARIYPLYFILVTLTALAAPIWSWSRWLCEITFARGFSDMYKFTGVAQGWSLTVEECFYFSFPVLLLCIQRWNFARTLAGIYVCGLALFAVGHYLPQFHCFETLKFVAIYTFPSRALDFLSGMFAARCVLDRERTDRGWPFWTIAGLSGASLCVACMAAIRYAERTPWTGMAIDHVMLPLCTAAFFYGIVTERSFVRWMLSLPPLVLAGKASFAFYLLHLGVIWRFMPAWATGSVWVHFLLANLISLVVYGTIEEPARRFISTLSLRRWPSRSRILPVSQEVQVNEP